MKKLCLKTKPALLFALFLSILFLSIVFAGCSLGADLMDIVSPGGSAKSSGGYDKLKYMEEAEEAPMERSAAPAPSMEGELPESDAAVDSGTAAMEPNETEPEERKRVYSGNGRLLVEDVETAKTRIADIAENAGGYIERSYEKHIQVRIPADSFESVFHMILETGEVLHSSVEAQDVTEFYRDLQIRLEIAEKSRDRLYTLLESAEDVEERVKILREIRRLTEEIERINRTFTMVEQLIAYSRISIELVPRLEEPGVQGSSIPFPWIADLDPLYPVFSELKGKVAVTLPDSYALFDKGDYFRAENAMGVRFRVTTGENNPRGSAEFWQKALAFHLPPFYKEAKPVSPGESEGKILGILFTSKDRIPFYYLAAVKPEEKHLHLIEAFFPDSQSFEEGYNEILQALEGMVIQ